MLKQMTKIIGIILLLGSAAFIFGCSFGSGALTVPDVVATNTPTSATEGHYAIGVFTFTLDPASQKVELIRHREAEKHYNITDLILPPVCPDCIGIHLQGIQPGTDTHIIQVNLKNPSVYTAYDVRAIILWNDGDTRTLENYEALTEMFDDGGTYTKNPFITFRELTDPTNAFGPGQIISKNFFISFPKPHNYNVKFVVECSFPSNSADPWLIYSADVSNPLDEGGTLESTISCRVADHQDDVTSVTIDLTKLGFLGPVDMTHITGEKWQTIIKNEYAAPKGHYFCLVEARDATDKWPLYDYIEIVVEPDSSLYVWVDSEYVGLPDGSPEHPYPSINTGINNADHGQIVMVKEGDYVENIELVDGAHIRGYGAQKPVVKGPGQASISASQFVKSAYVETLILQGNGSTTLYGIYSLDASNLEFHDIDFVSTGSVKSFQQAVRVDNTQGFVLADCRIQNLKATGSAPILINVSGSSEIIFESNFIKSFSFSPGSPFPAGTGAVIYFFDCDDIVIRQNIIALTTGLISDFDSLDFSAIRINVGTNVILRNNLIYDLIPNGDCNLTLAAITTNGTANFEMENLTIDNIGAPDQPSGIAYGINIMFGSGTMLNNILTDVKKTVKGHGYGVNSGINVTQTYSDVWTIGASDDDRYEGKASEGVGGLNDNPQYVNPGTGDYHLQPTSPCLTTGMGGAQMGAYGGAEPLDLP